MNRFETASIRSSTGRSPCRWRWYSSSTSRRGSASPPGSLSRAAPAVFPGAEAVAAAGDGRRRAPMLIVADWFCLRRASSTDIARINRGIGLIVIWSAALLARNTLGTRLKLREQEWLRTARTRIADAVVGEQSLPRMSERVLEGARRVPRRAGRRDVRGRSQRRVRARGRDRACRADSPDRSSSPAKDCWAARSSSARRCASKTCRPTT